ncbi:ATP-dependent DNA helicase RecG [Smaragdicoccus niigatensis]|uniref:ATP-dependent DNA helicase RecG n=1 Tax=Smaragdicoccus niigatensis TaxID=359359 RepID=UPI00035CD005|nr:ATP-dependent DNA helicase RecG [Smaragdicoccus niigatensis]
MTTLSDRLEFVVGGKAATVLAEEFDIHTVEDLLRHYPHRYATQAKELSDTPPAEGDRITAMGYITKTELKQIRNNPRQKLLLVTLDTDQYRKPVQATFFNGNKVNHVLKADMRVMFSGTVKYFRESWSLQHPGYLVMSEDDDAPVKGAGALGGLAKAATGPGGLDKAIFDRSLIPIYPATAKFESWDVFRCIRQVFDLLDDVPDPLSPEIRAEHGLIELGTALRLIHLPDHKHDVDAAKDRLRFDEAAALQLSLALRRREAHSRPAPACAGRDGGLLDAFDARLPFELTEGQLEVGEEITYDLSQRHPMSRLLQGEVGSGKTVVSLRAMLRVIDSGYQCALLAPTEVLAAQHARTLRSMLGELATAGELGAAEEATSIALLTGSMSTAAKREALLKIVTGDAGIVVGTHALIQDNVDFFDLGFVVVDEQHRFGVEQRDQLRSKGRDGVSPHMLVMTATPIPRTIAVSVLGDLETSTLRQLPAGRSPIVSRVVPAESKPQWVDRAWQRIREEVAEGRQAYVVCSRIGDGENDELIEPKDDDDDGKAKKPPTVAVVDLFEQLSAGPLAGLRVGLLHGRLPADEKDATMRAFGRGELDVLVSTTVIEVGVDVPNATTMVIMDADRFGISQLHQLRGRVGRGKHAGLCILITLSKGPALERLNKVAATNDGFQLATLDLETRREGDILGAAQSGTKSNLRLLSLIDDLPVILEAQKFAREVVAGDPTLADHPGLLGMARAAVNHQRLDYIDKN